MAQPKKYDLDLFLQLNEEYTSKRVQNVSPPIDDAEARRAYKARVAAGIAKKLKPYADIRGKRVLDFGCGRGDVCVALAQELGCTAFGVDIRNYKEWAAIEDDRVRLQVLDLCEEENARLLDGQIDVIVSNSVLEHVVHPYAALRGMRTVVGAGGIIYLKANLYRGPLASHRYRDVFFPWPHLLFTDEVFGQFYQHLGKAPRRPAWVNKLTHLHYRDYFERLGFDVLNESYSTKPIDEDFYARFEDILSRYPRSDLEKDFINVVLRPREATSSAGGPSRKPGWLGKLRR